MPGTEQALLSLGAMSQMARRASLRPVSIRTSSLRCAESYAEVPDAKFDREGVQKGKTRQHVRHTLDKMAACGGMWTYRLGNRPYLGPRSGGRQIGQTGHHWIGLGETNSARHRRHTDWGTGLIWDLSQGSAKPGALHITASALARRIQRTTARVVNRPARPSFYQKRR